MKYNLLCPELSSPIGDIDCSERQKASLDKRCNDLVELWLCMIPPLSLSAPTPSHCCMHKSTLHILGLGLHSDSIPHFENPSLESRVLISTLQACVILLL
mmetsp:Transcript_17692/g.21215  ORF Transcript_17692/g.21215 Transcript_17692/m.21215 type:complete len:100 (+) Transcript_17692:1149-1448(+)